MGSIISKNTVTTYDTFQEYGNLYDNYYDIDNLLNLPKLNHDIPVWSRDFI